MKIGYLGPKGTFSEQALKKYLNENKISNAEAIPVSSFFDLFQVFSSGKCDKIIVPIENSIEGSVSINFDLLAKAENALIEQEILLDIEQNLLGNIGTAVDQITDIYSHPQPLAQCQKYLKTHFPDVRTYQLDSTSLAAEMVAKPELSIIAHSNKQQYPDKKFVYAAIGSRELAEIYGLKILAENIGDYPNNTTQFFVVGRNKTISTGSDKTSILFSTLKDRPGGLYEILGEFASENINLTRITSRPTKEVLGEYLFFIDFEGHVDDPVVQEVLASIQTKASFFKLLGSYKKQSTGCSSVR